MTLATGRHRCPSSVRPGWWPRDVLIGLASGLSTLGAGTRYLFLAYRERPLGLSLLGGPADCSLIPPVDRRVRSSFGRQHGAGRCSGAHGGPFRRRRYRLEPGPLDPTGQSSVQRRRRALSPPVGLPDSAAKHLPPARSPTCTSPAVLHSSRAPTSGLVVPTILRPGASCRSHEYMGAQRSTRYFALRPTEFRSSPWAPMTEPYDAPSVADLQAARSGGDAQAPFLLYPAQTWPIRITSGCLKPWLAFAIERGLRIRVVSPPVAATTTPARSDEVRADTGLLMKSCGPGSSPARNWQPCIDCARPVVMPSFSRPPASRSGRHFCLAFLPQCSDVTSLPEQAGDAALSSIPRRRAMADSIARIWSDQETRATLVAKGRDRVAGFTWARTATTFRALYRQVAGRPFSDEDITLLAAKPGI